MSEYYIKHSSRSSFVSFFIFFSFLIPFCTISLSWANTKENVKKKMLGYVSTYTVQPIKWYKRRGKRTFTVNIIYRTMEVSARVARRLTARNEEKETREGKNEKIKMGDDPQKFCVAEGSSPVVFLSYWNKGGGRPCAPSTCAFLFYRRPVVRHWISFTT